MTEHTDPFRGPLAALFGGDPALHDSRALASLLTPAATALPVASATSRGVWDRANGSVDTAAIDDILARADREAGTPWPVPLASLAARVHRDGDRDAWESLAFERQRRLSRATIAAAVTLEDRWIDSVADGVLLLCEQTSWCWPAHDDTFVRHGSVLATVDDPFLDLGAGEVVGQLAWLDHLLGAALDERYPGLRARIRHEARVRVLEPFQRRRDWHWLGLDGDVHNWNPWIHGNVLVAALRLLDAPDEAVERAHVVALVIEGLDRYVASLPADGAIDEGYSYWWNGACRALEALDLLAHATDGRWDAAPSVTALRETVAFPHRMHLGGDWYLNLADGQAKPPARQPWHCLHRAARRIGDDDARAHAASHRAPGTPAATEHEGLGRLLRGITDAAWLAEPPASPPLPRETWLASTDVLVAREEAARTAGLTLAVKGGHNGEHHNHNDVGSFVVAADGVPVIVDAGRPTYTAATFGPDRYDIWTMQSSWHNVPEIRATAQSAGAVFAASAVTPEADGAGLSPSLDAAGLSPSLDAAGLSLELAAAYAAPGLESWHRTARLTRRTPAARAHVTIDDAWRLSDWTDGEEPPTTVRLLLAGEVALDAAAAVVQPLEEASAVRITWSPAVPATLVERPLDDPLLSDVWGDRLTRLDLLVTDSRELRLTVELDEPTDKDRR